MASVPLDCYQDALKQGQKEFKNCVHRGQYPYIQSLSQVEGDFSRLSKVNLGLMEIPLYLIVGSTEDQRCSSFSPGFYPLLSANSEFAAKWTTLYAHQLSEGISDPIKCFEYLGNFYVSEGNKRVSVLKSIGGASVWANVTRLLPEDGDNITVQLYQEFLEFYRCAGFYGVHFSDLGSYAKLQAALGFAKGEAWPEDYRKKFQNCFLAFRSCFYKLGGVSLGLTTGDVLLRWLQFYPLDDFLTGDEALYRQTLTAVWEELSAAAETGTVAVTEEPAEDVGGGLASLLPFNRSRTLKVAFLFQKTPQDSPWTAAHDQGRAYAEKAMGESVSVQTYYNVPTDERAEAAIQTAVDEGAELIFTTAVSLLPASLRAAVKFPKVRIMNCSIDQPYVNVTAYYSRIYEGKFITGAIAGALCRGDRIGYVGSYPILGVPASINAFALGVALTNPTARVELLWHCLPGDEIAAFRDQGLELVSNRDSSSAEEITRPLGLFRFGEDGACIPVASPVWKWGEYYVHLIQETLSGARRGGGKAVNHWWGMSADVVDVLLSDDLPEGVRTLAGILRDGLRNGTLRPFHRPITAQDGTAINDGSRDLTMEEILKMDRLCDRVDGVIPAYEELLPVAKPTVRLLGVFKDAIPPEEGTP